jgi:hypothetical protein
MSDIEITEAVDQIAEEVAHEYVRLVKQWPVEDYHLEILRSDSAVVVVDAVHKDDLTGSKSPNKSVQLHVDVQDRKVTRELAYQ